MEEEYFSCQCSDFNHVIRFGHSPYDGEVWLEMHMNYCDPWWKRVWSAVKYVFKRDVAYGHYDVTMLREEDYDRLRDVLNQSEIAKAAAISRTRDQLLKS